MSVGVSELDQKHQKHQKLISIINELDSAMSQGKGKEVLHKVISGLIVYVKTHFETEERYLKEANYPEFASHQEEHIAFIKKISAFKNDYLAGKMCLSIEIMNFLSCWLIDHIKVKDKHYSPCLSKAGVR
ncbi:bacteriohemerythrin [Verrucomicrobiota bacterium]